MKDILLALEGTPLPTFLVIGGLALIVLALAGGFSDKIAIPPQRQRLTGILGSIFVLLGVILYMQAPAPAEEAQDIVPTPPPATAVGSAPTAVPTPTPQPTPDVAETEPFVETFVNPQTWPLGEFNDTFLTISGGQYIMRVLGSEQTAWSTSEYVFDDGIYSVEGALLSGSLDASYGIIWRSDNSADEFYAFQVDGNGLVWIGRCLNACAQRVMLVGSGWFTSDAVRVGYNETNVLRVEADGGSLAFFVNGVEVGRSVDAARLTGAIGVMMETADGTDTSARFDNYTVIPAGN
jgi:hypothetical protein